MAEAGWPFRHETFYYSHRRGGPHLLPFDPKEEIKKLNPFNGLSESLSAYKWLEEKNGTPFGAWLKGLTKEHFDKLQVQAPPVGSWICDRDPMFVVSGPSFAVSWLEPLVLQWNYRIQIATLAANDPAALQKEVETVTSEDQKLIIQETVEVVRRLGYTVPELTIEIKEFEYYNHVFNKVKELIEVVGDPNRIFEVGMRGVSCEDQHMIALEAARDSGGVYEGLKATSNVGAAMALGLKSVGTMGHEHVQRFGSDEAAYRAMVERLPGSVFFLLDTFHTLSSGIPAAFKIIEEQPERGHAVRFDSGDIRGQFIHAVRLAKKMGIKPKFCLEDGWNLEKTIEFEALRKELDLPREQVLYGYGGYIVNSPFTTLTRDRVSAVWKLTQTGDTPTMKFGSEHGKGKESIPGRPILYWSEDGTYIMQRGEKVPIQFANYECSFSEGGRKLPNYNRLNLAHDKYYSGLYSPGTKALVRHLTEKRNRIIKDIKNA